jgi:alpha-glucosidase
MENQRATYEGLLKLRPEERPFVLTRATYAGGQRYGFTWTGDNASTWNDLRFGTQMVLNLGLSGISFVGDDVGGFGGSPQPELLTRWIELGAFKPLYRDHASKGTLPQEVWVHGPDHEAIRRRYIETRYRLMPYIYTLAEEASRTGLPLVRPVFLEFPEVMAPQGPAFGALDSEFLLGPDLLVAPPPFGDLQDAYAVSYPPGEWFDFWTGQKMPPQVTGPGIVEVANAIAAGSSKMFPEPATIHPPLDTMPVYVRAGSILPMQPVVQSTAEKPQGPLELRVYPGQRCEGSLYLDDGHSFLYRQGEYLRQSFTCRMEGNSVVIGFNERQGTFAPWWNAIELVIYDWPSGTAEVKTGGKTISTKYDSQHRALHVMIPDSSAKQEIRVNR